MSSSSTISSAALLGCATGLRSMTGAAALARQWGSPKLANSAAIAAAGEYIADKLPFIPARVKPAALAGRMIFGAICGALVARHRGETAAPAIVAGVIGATAASYAGYYARKKLAGRGVPDFAVALVEDAVAAGLAMGAARVAEREGIF
jgi:uncharacterized membrane protein